MAYFVPCLGLAKKYLITEEEKTFGKIVAKAKAVFDEAVEKNLIKRRPLVEVYLEPKDLADGNAYLKIFLQGEPDCSQYAVALPRISIEFDFEAMRAFAAKQRINEKHFSLAYDPISNFYDIVLEKDLFDEWKNFRQAAYNLRFDEWVSLCTNEINLITAG